MKNSYLYLLSTAWKHATTKKKLFVAVYVFFIFSNVVVSLRPIVYGWFIGELQGTEEGVVSFAWTYVAIYIGIYILEWMFNGPARLAENKMAFHIGKNFTSSLYDKLLHLPVDWHKTHHTGATVNRIRKAETAIKSFFKGASWHLRMIIQLVTAVAAMIYFSPWFALVAIALGVVSMFAVGRFDGPYVRSLDEVNEGEHKVSAALTDSLTNIITVTTLRLENKFSQRLLKVIDNVFKPFWRGVWYNEGKWFTAGFLVNVIYCIMVMGFVYTHHVPGQPFDIGGLVTLLGFVFQFTGVFVDVGALYTQIMKDRTDVKAVEGIEALYQEYHS
ncbi:MAG: ABC transporter transmembrane domain-containing protein [Bacteroidota bacterium]